MRNIQEKYTRKKVETVLSLSNLYKIWYDKLTLAAIRIFEWNGLPFKQHEFEKRMIIMGYAPLLDDAKLHYMTSYGSLHGVTQYYDEFTKFTYAAPTAKGGTLELGKKVVICHNNCLKIPMVDLIEKYAAIGAHTDLTIKCGLINSRENKAFVARNQQARDDIEKYNHNIEEGKPYTILAQDVLGVPVVENPLESYRYSFNLSEAIDGQNEILRSFYREIGITWTKEKKGNMTEDEVVNDRELLLFNIDDMLKCRKEFCIEANEVFGLNINVELASPFKMLTDDKGVEYDGDN